LIKRKNRAPETEQVETEQVRYQATAPEREALNKQVERLNAGPPASRIKIQDAEGRPISLDHPDAVRALKEALGTADVKFVNAFLAQIAGSGIDREEFGFVLAVIAGIKPNDQLEAMQAAQMAAVHMATMKFAGELDRANWLRIAITLSAPNTSGRRRSA
jgi:hypothetical protein